MVERPIILYRGLVFTVEYAVQENGCSDSQAFIETLNVKLRTKIVSIIKRFADIGKIYNREQFRKVEGKLFEFKHFQTRVIMYHCAKGCVALTHGFIKKTQNTSREEIERAKRIMLEYDKIRRGFRHE